MHLAYFHAPWCAVCHVKAPLVETLAARHALPLETYDIETPAGRAEYERRGLTQVPTLALVHGERMPFRLVGAMITPETVDHLMGMHRPS